MKHLLTLLLLSFSSLALAKPQKLALTVEAESAILMNADTGAILYEKNSHDLHYPASITKIVTGICALEKAGNRMDVMIAGDQECIGTVTEAAFRRSNYTLPAHLLIPDGCHIGIKNGELLSLKDLLHGMMVASGDDAANVIAKYAGGTIPKFIEEMNLFAKRVGCRSTTFCNPHGLHHPKQQTTAYDMALITKEALKNPTFREIVKTTQYTRPKTNKQEATTLVQTNKLLRRGPYFYPKAIGIKTGFYSLAKHTFVAAAKDGDRTLIAVLMKVNDRKDMFIDSKKMFEAAFSQPKVQRILLRKGPQKFTLELPEASKTIKTYITDDVALEYYPAEEPVFKFQLVWDKDLKLPIAKDQKIGHLVIALEDRQIIKKVPLLAAENIKASWFTTFKQSGMSLILKVFAIIAIFSLLTFFFIKFRQRSA
ncbi:MAG: D-alanyl-D-alanine carboxypeptidase family protein [Parachlamydiaceae bacterium]